MKKLHFVLSLTNDENDYQTEQARSAEEAAQRLGAGLEISYADNDSVTQSQQLLNIIQSRSTNRPDGILLEPVGGTALPQVARAAAAAGVAWVVLNRDVDYMSELRQAFRVPMFSVTSDHEEIGRIQGRQVAALLPKGGSVLYIQGPSDSLAARQRTQGVCATKPANVELKLMRGQWTEASAHRTVSSWLRLSTAAQMPVDAVAAQDDSMALGARRAFQDQPDSAARDRWLNLPFLGCDGMPKTGQAWVRSGLLTATIVIPSNTGQALDLLVKALQSGVQPNERTLTACRSYPPIELLGSASGEKGRSASV